MLQLLHAIILSIRRSTADKIIACNYCTWNRTFIWPTFLAYNRCRAQTI